MSNIKLYNGDCLEVMNGIPDKSIDLIVTDPPYGKKADKGTNGFGCSKNRRYQEGGINMFDFIKIQVQALKDMANDKKSKQMCYYEDNDYIYIAYVTIAYRIPKLWCYLKLSSLKNMSYLQKLFLFDCSKEWKLENTLVKYSDIGNKYAYRFTNNNDEMFIDKKLFDSINWKQGDNIKFYAESNLSVMKIVQDDIVKAVIMPVKMKG